MRVTSIIIALCMAGLAGCASPGAHGFRGHLEEAISLNEERRSIYAELAYDHRPEHDLSKQSESVSGMLIRLEKKAVLASYLPTWFWKGVNFDAAARPYQRSGIPIIQEDLVSMADVPDIELYQPPFPALEDRIQGRSEYDFDDEELATFESVAEVLEQEIDRLSEEPRFNCMLRHGLESALRIANHAPIYVELAEERGLKSPEKLLWRILRSHFWAIADANEIDRQAAPLQARGIPIICNDVPPIPPCSEWALRHLRNTGLTDDC